MNKDEHRLWEITSDIKLTHNNEEKKKLITERNKLLKKLKIQ